MGYFADKMYLPLRKNISEMTMKKLFYTGILLFWLPLLLIGENGYELWLRYRPLPETEVQQYA
ncbi:MAG TPA: hypothetical protein PKJ24_06105, partial [Prolixibacteraceae bacterium]|nr:hypothetical protein [Prolixibacteraceae bacterium]